MSQEFKTPCNHCNKYFSMVDYAWLHEPCCPTRSQIDEVLPKHLQEPEPIQRADQGHIVSLGAARFDRAKYPHETSTLDVFDNAKTYIDSLEPGMKPDHIIVVIGKRIDDKGGSGLKFIQSGKFSSHEQFGLMWSAMLEMRNTGHE